MISKRIASGLYEVKASGRVFQVEDWGQARGDGVGRGEWMLYEMIMADEVEKREWCNDFTSKRSAMEAIQVIVNEAA